MTKLLHMADVHLGKRFGYNDVRFSDMENAFEFTAKRAIEENCGIVLICGDLFDSAQPDGKTVDGAVRVLSMLRGKYVYCIEGNHDKDSGALEYLEKKGLVRLLGQRNGGFQECIEIVDDVRVIGLCYSEELEESLKKLCESLENCDIYTVLMLHGTFSNTVFSKKTGWIDKKCLEKLNGKIDYFALGHGHMTEIISSNIIMPGSLENVTPKQARLGGEKGFFIVDTKNEQKTFIKTPLRNFFSASCKLQKGQDPFETIMQNFGSFQKDTWIELCLCGDICRDQNYIESLSKKVEKASGAAAVEVCIV